MFKTMIPICSACLEELRANSMPRPMQEDKPVKMYHRMFFINALGRGIDYNGEIARQLFINGLTAVNRQTIQRFNPSASIGEIVEDLTVIEDYENAVHNINQIASPTTRPNN
jgi:hypothetical protein